MKNIVTVDGVQRKIDKKRMKEMLAEDLTFSKKELKSIVEKLVSILDGKVFVEEDFGSGTVEDYYAECVREYLTDEHSVEDFLKDTDDCLYPYEFFHTLPCPVCGRHRFHIYFVNGKHICNFCYAESHKGVA